MTINFPPGIVGYVQRGTKIFAEQKFANLRYLSYITENLSS